MGGVSSSVVSQSPQAICAPRGVIPPQCWYPWVPVLPLTPKQTNMAPWSSYIQSSSTQHSYQTHSDTANVTQLSMAPRPGL